jgi:hypothetical protein
MVDISLQDVRYAARQLPRTPVDACVVVTPALAVGAAAPSS